MSHLSKTFNIPEITTSLTTTSLFIFKRCKGHLSSVKENYLETHKKCRGIVGIVLMTPFSWQLLKPLHCRLIQFFGKFTMRHRLDNVVQTLGVWWLHLGFVFQQWRFNCLAEVNWGLWSEMSVTGRLTKATITVFSPVHRNLSKPKLKRYI